MQQYRPDNVWRVGLSYLGCRCFYEGALAQAQWSGPESHVMNASSNAKMRLCWRPPPIQLRTLSARTRIIHPWVSLENRLWSGACGGIQYRVLIFVVVSGYQRASLWSARHQLLPCASCPQSLACVVLYCKFLRILAVWFVDFGHQVSSLCLSRYNH
jgi:hypothetical protein